MKLNSYLNAPSRVSIRAYPFVLIIALLLVHYLSGTLAFNHDGSVRDQRDFNTATTMTLLSGYFWFCLQLNYNNVLSTLISILVKTNQLSHLRLHRKKLSAKLQQHSINSLILAVFTTVIYVITENFFLSEVKLHQYAIIVCAVLFWFFFFLILTQSSSNLSYLREHVLNQTESYIDYLNSLSSLARLSFMNATLSIGAFSLFPIFWIKQTVLLIDIIIALLFLCVVTFYLFHPVLKLYFQWEAGKKKQSNELNRLIKKEVSLEKLAQYEQELERLSLLSMKIIRFNDKVRFIACISLIAISWGFVLLFFSSFKGQL